MNSTSEMCAMNLCLLCLDKMKCVYFTHVFCVWIKGDVCCVHASPLSQLKNTLALNPHLLYLDKWAKF
jgi:hypothetical protein